MAVKGVIYLIPLPLSPEGLSALIPLAEPYVRHIRHFVVENIRTSRRFLRAVDADFPIDECMFFEMDKHEDYRFDARVLDILNNGSDIGIMSEAGCPAVADPGYQVVAAAHRQNIKVIPLPGPNSMIMALMASGFKGQAFTFHGYLPVDTASRRQMLLQIEKNGQAGYPQIFMETPYRNNQLLDDIIRWLQPSTLLCVAANITASNEMIQTRSLAEWSTAKPNLHKIPAVFIIGKTK
jgi:16S rRNA (cytidine1402-2'-O)-methyltransferase